MAATVGDMTVEELKRLIADTVAEAIDQRLTRLLGNFEIDEQELFADDEIDSRTWEEVKRDVERDRWTPPPGAKSSLALLREARDS